MNIYSLQGVSIVVGNRRMVFTPFIPLDVQQETADYLLSTGRFYREGETPINAEAEITKRPVRVGVYRVGGFGDALLGSCVIEAIHRKFPNSRIVAHTHSNIQRLWTGHPHIYTFDTSYHPRLNGSPFIVPRYDAFFDLMPDCNVEYNKRTMKPEHYFLAQKAKEKMAEYKKIPGCTNHLKPFCNDKSFEALDVYNFMFGTDATIKDMYIPQSDTDKTYYSRLLAEKRLPSKYISVHDWAFNGRQTKSWYPAYWEELNKLLSKEFDLPTVQIGGGGEENLYADYDLRGKTTFSESVDVLRHSVFHVDNESSPAHICPAIGTPCIVLCGSTLKYWRHRENLNIVGPYHCQECEGFPNWFKVCSDNSSFGCMKSITPEYAFDKIIKSNYIK